MGLLHCVSGNGFGHLKRKTHVYLSVCLDSGIELVFLSFDRLHIYHARMLLGPTGCITCVTLIFNHISMLIRFQGYTTLNINGGILVSFWTLSTGDTFSVE